MKFEVGDFVELNKKGLEKMKHPSNGVEGRFFSEVHEAYEVKVIEVHDEFCRLELTNDEYGYQKNFGKHFVDESVLRLVHKADELLEQVFYAWLVVLQGDELLCLSNLKMVDDCLVYEYRLLGGLCCYDEACKTTINRHLVELMDHRLDKSDEEYIGIIDLKYLDKKVSHMIYDIDLKGKDVKLLTDRNVHWIKVDDLEQYEWFFGIEVINCLKRWYGNRK